MLAEKATSLLMFISVERKIYHPQDTHLGFQLIWAMPFPLMRDTVQVCFTLHTTRATGVIDSTKQCFQNFYIIDF